MDMNNKMNLDMAPDEINNNDWIWAKNMVKDKRLTHLKNEDGYVNYSSFVSSSYLICGYITIPNGFILLSNNSSTGKSRITRIITKDRDVYTSTTIIDTIYLSFSPNNPLKGTYKYNNRGELIIVIVGERNTPYLINCDAFISSTGTASNASQIKLDVDYEIQNYTYPDGSTVSASDISQLLRLFPNYKQVDYRLIDVISGGSIDQGVCYIVIKYNYIDNSSTDWLIPSQPVNVFDIDDTTNDLQHRVVQGKVNKCINMDLGNVDPKFKSFTVGVINKSNSQLTAYECNTYNIVSADSNYKHRIKFDGSYVKTTTIDELLTNTITCDSVKTCTNFNNQLIIANIKNSEIEYQKYANNIQTKYRLTNIGKNKYNDSVGIYFDKTFMPHEVYAFYIILVKAGRPVGTYHIPGRLPTTTTVQGNVCIETAIGVDGDGTGNDTHDYQYDVNVDTQVPVATEELALVASGLKLFNIYPSRTIDAVSYGDNSLLHYWENTNEKYPYSEDYEIWTVNGSGVGSRDVTNDTLYDQNGVSFNNPRWSNLIAGDVVDSTDINTVKSPVNVRHHRMPDEDYCNSIGGAYTSIKVEFGNINFPKDILNNIDGYYIGYATRDNTNSIIIANSFLNTWDKPTLNTPNATTSDARFMDRNVNHLKFNINNCFIRDSIKYNANGTIAAGIPDIYSFDIFASGGGTGDFNNAKGRISRIVSSEYLPENNASTTPSNAYRSDVLNIKVSNNLIPLDFYYADMGSGVCRLTTTKVYLQTYNLNPYFDYTIMNVVIGSLYHKIVSGQYTGYTVTDSIGDSFINSVAHYSWNGYESTDGNSIRLDIVAPIYANINNYLTDRGLVATLYPMFNLPHYDNTFSSINNIKTLSVFNINDLFIDKFPKRILLSNTFNNESISNKWRQFEVTNYHELESQYDIIKLMSSDDSLFIHTTNALYLTRVKDGIDTLNGTLSLNISPIFDTKVQEVVYDSNGYLGLVNSEASLICKHGYISLDRNKGVLSIFNNGIKLISDESFMRFLYDNFNYTTIEVDNPYLYSTVSLGYDEKYDRLIITKRERKLISTYTYKGIYNSSTTYAQNDVVYKPDTGYLYKVGASPTFTLSIVSTNDFIDNNITLSYSFINNGLVSLHDYAGDVYLNDRYNTFALNSYTADLAIQGQYINRFNSKTNKCKFLNEVLYSSYIDIVVRTQNTQILDVINWFTDYMMPNINKSPFDYKYEILNYDKTIDGIIVYTNNQCSGLIDTNINTDWYDKNSGRQINKQWFIGKLKDVVINNKLPFIDSNKALVSGNINKSMDWYSKSQFIDNFFIVRLIINNTVNSFTTGTPPTQVTTNYQNEVYIKNLNVKYRNNNR